MIKYIFSVFQSGVFRGCKSRSSRCFFGSCRLLRRRSRQCRRGYCHCNLASVIFDSFFNTTTTYVSERERKMQRKTRIIALHLGLQFRNYQRKKIVEFRKLLLGTGIKVQIFWVEFYLTLLSNFEKKEILKKMWPS